MFCLYISAAIRIINLNFYMIYKVLMLENHSETIMIFIRCFMTKINVSTCRIGGEKEFS